VKRESATCDAMTDFNVLKGIYTREITNFKPTESTGASINETGFSTRKGNVPKR